MIVRNENLPEARATMRVIQDRFNDQANYPWILLNDQHFNADFKRHASAIVARSNTSVFFGKIDANEWAYPRWVDVPRAESALWDLVGVKRGESLSHHQLLRYQAGLFFNHPLFTNVEYTWRIEPGSMYTCALKTDPFLVMKKEGKKIGFVLTGKEDQKAIPSLWSTTQSFMEKYPQWIKPRNRTILPGLINEDGDYNHCHMWSNFEILDLSFVRSEVYQAYFNHLDLASGFFYEKWGDPVRTLAAALFLNKSQIHFFDQIGYTNDATSHCPLNNHSSQQCTCDVSQSHGKVEIHATF
ncbi:glycosyl transferase [Chlamydoabsidia padenii]|nr:glycosyl transferase [Chlamydoabsidia padenii]